MLITVKNLQQQTFTIDFQAEKTVLELKEKIFKERGSEYIVEKQKLIYAGVILSDERTVASYNIDEHKFVVVMLKRDIGGSISKADGNIALPNRPEAAAINLQKEGTPQKPDQCESKSSEKKESGDNLESNLPSNNEGSKDDSSAASSNRTTAESVPVGTSSTESQPLAESNLIMGEEYSRTIDSIIEMGYGREMVERAMAASFNNPERAVEYLINGIPEMELFTPTSVANLLSDQNDRNRRNTTDPVGNDPFAFLRNQPQFLQMRSLVYENPDLLHAVLQQIGQTNPALLQLISENQDAFLSMLNEPNEDGSASQQPRQFTIERSGESNSSSSAGGDGPLRTLSNIIGSGTRQLAAENILAGLGSANRPAGQSIPVSVERSNTAENTESSNRAATLEQQNRDDGQFRIPTEDSSAIRSSNNEVRNNEYTTLRLTAQEQDAIERLKALGFSETLVLQAYFACDKDEQLAANFLITSNFDD